MIHETILQLKMNCLPRKGFPSIGNPNWAGHALQHVCNEILELADSGGSRQEALNQILDDTVYFVLNYTSLKNSGERWTFTVANTDRFNLPMPDVQSLRAPRHERMRLCRYAILDDRVEAVESSAEEDDAHARLTALWAHNWETYLDQPGPLASLTLNELLLRRANRPTPFALNWVGGEDGDAFRFPIAIHIQPESADKISVATSLANAGLPDGCASSIMEARSRFERDYFGKERLEPSIASMKAEERLFFVLRSLVRHFRLEGAEGFVSLPVLISTEHHPKEFTDFLETRLPGRSDIGGLRSVVSYSLREGVSPEARRLAFEFYRGVATEVLKDIMVHESAHTLRQILKETREKVLSGITHPTKNSVIRAKTGVEDIWKKIGEAAKAYENGQSVDFAKLKHAALRAKHQTTAATNRLNLIHFGAAMFENADRLSELKLRAEANAKARTAGMDVLRILEWRSREVVSKVDITTGIVLRLPESERAVMVPRRFQGTALEHEAHQELELLQTVIDELLENAATHGEFDDATGENAKVRVGVAIYPGESGTCICLSNKISLADRKLNHFLVREAPQDFELVKPDNTSGLALASQLLSMLSIGELSTRWLKQSLVKGEKKLVNATWQSRIEFTDTWRVDR